MVLIYCPLHNKTFLGYKDVAVTVKELVLVHIITLTKMFLFELAAPPPSPSPPTHTRTHTFASPGNIPVMLNIPKSRDIKDG